MQSFWVNKSLSGGHISAHDEKNDGYHPCKKGKTGRNKGGLLEGGVGILLDTNGRLRKVGSFTCPASYRHCTRNHESCDICVTAVLIQVHF